MKIRPIRGLAELNLAVETAKLDNHVLIAPTHLVLSGDEIRGALSFIPTALVWMHTQRNNARDSVKMEELLAGHIAISGGTAFCLPCLKTSPYYPLLPKVGYVNTGEINLFIKGL